MGTEKLEREWDKLIQNCIEMVQEHLKKGLLNEVRYCAINNMDSD